MQDTGNHLKTELEIVQEDSTEMELDVAVEPEEKVKPKKKRKKNPQKEKEDAVTSEENNIEKIAFHKRVIQFLQDERTHKISGLVTVLFAVYSAVAMISYFMTWKTDQDLVNKFSWSLLFSPEIIVKNHLGRLGAFLSHQFVFNGFGVMSALIPILLFSAGLNMVFKKSIMPLSAIFKFSLIAMSLLSVSLQFIFSTIDFPIGGAFGSVINSYLNNFLGSIGTATLLGTIILSTLVWIFNVDFNQIIPKKKLQALRTENDSPLPEAILDTPTPTRVKVINPQPIVNPSDIVNTVKKEEVEEKTFVQPEDTFTTVNPKNKQENTDAEGELTLDIVETADEEILENVEYGSIQSQYDPTLDLSGYEFPNLELMNNYGSDKIKIDPEELERNKDQIVQTLQNYNIDIQKIKATVGPTVTLYEIVPAPGVRISKIKNLEDDIALSLAALGIRIIAPIPGKGTIGIEVPNINKDTVSMRSLIASEKFQHAQMDLPIALGKTISNEIFVADLAKMPHLLVAGATGQGKSVGINSILISLLYKKHPSQLKFVMIDPKKVELSLYSKIEKHFLAKLPGEEDPIIVDTKKVINTLKALCVEMDLRYNLLKDAGVRNLNQYNEKFLNRKLNPENGHRYLPYIVLVIDEFADLIMTAGKEVEMPIARLAQLARAIGIHLIIATQRPSVNIITGTIKANFPARIAFRVQSKIDSRTILDQGGADQLIGRGDLLLSVGGDTIRLQCGFVDTPEAEKIVDFIGEQKGYPEAMLLPEVHDEEGDQMMDDFNLDDRDEFFDEAAHLIVSTQQGSTSLIQRKLKLGYNRAGRLMDQLEAAGVVGPVRGSKPREVLIKDIIHLEQFLGGKE